MRRTALIDTKDGPKGSIPPPPRAAASTARTLQWQANMFGRFKDQVRRLTEVARGVPTIEQLVTLELDQHLAQEIAIGETKASTRALYRRAAKDVVARWGQLRPSELTPNVLRAAMPSVPFPSQWNIWMALLGRVLARAVDDGLIASRPRLPRHSWITKAAEFGSLEQIRRCTNHSAERMTARYSHLSIGEVLPLVNRVGAAIGGSDD